MLSSHGIIDDTKKVKNRDFRNNLIGALLGGGLGTGAGMLLGVNDLVLPTAIGTGLGMMGSTLVTNGLTGSRIMSKERKELLEALESGKVKLGDNDELTYVG